MTEFQQPALQFTPSWVQQSEYRAAARLLRKAGRLSILLILAGVCCTHGWGQVQSGTGRQVETGVFVTAGGGNTQFPDYADNAIGLNFGAFVQPKTFLGVEVRGGTYPFSARFTQSPITAGLRAARLQTRNGRFYPFAYIGGGYSWSQDSGPTLQPMPAKWDLCWQASAGLDASFGRFSWRAAEGSWTKTYTPRAVLRTPYVSTGIAFRIGRSPKE